MKTVFSFLIGVVVGASLMFFDKRSNNQVATIKVAEMISDDFSRQCFLVEIQSADPEVESHIKKFSNNRFCFKYIIQNNKLYEEDVLAVRLVWEKNGEIQFIKEMYSNRVNNKYRFVSLEPEGY